MKRLALIAALASTAGLALAGPLNPPAGAVAPTGKTLTEVEPRTAINATNTPGDALWAFKITQPGSYYLTDRIAGAAVAGKGGILVAADNVTIDLGGFTITGNNTSARDGIGSPSLNKGVVVRHGSIENFAGQGVALGERASLEDLRITSCAGGGIEAWDNSVAVGCVVASCGTYGYKLWGPGTVAERCVVSACGVGFNGPNRLSHCAASLCTTAGFYVYVAADDCDAQSNSGYGFQTSNGSVVSHCTATNNTIAGFSVGNEARAVDCSAYSNSTYGFDAHAGSTLDRCSAGDNAVGAVRASGFYSRITECTLGGVSGFPVVSIDANMPGVQVERCHITGGTYAIAGATALNALLISNHCIAQTTGFTSVPAATNQIGPVVGSAGTIASTSPFANFVR